MKRARILLLSATMIAAVLSISGCGGWEGVPLENVKPISRDIFRGGGTEVTVSVYAKGSLYLTVTNILKDYRLKEIPEITSETGDVVMPSMKGVKEISFNYDPKGANPINSSEQDIRITWTLEETGEEGFLILRKEVLIDLVHDSGEYRVDSVKVIPLVEQE